MGLRKLLKKLRKRLKRLSAAELTQFGMIIRKKGKYKLVLFYLPEDAHHVAESIRPNERTIEIIEVRQLGNDCTESSLSRRVDILNRRQSRTEKRRKDIPALLRP